MKSITFYSMSEFRHWYSKRHPDYLLDASKILFVAKVSVVLLQQNYITLEYNAGSRAEGRQPLSDKLFGDQIPKPTH